MEIKNAKIESTMLGFEDHGILTCVLHLDYGNSGQGFGTYMLDSKKDIEKVPHNYGIRFIRQILEVLEVDEWEKLPGTPIRVEAEFDKVHRIGHLLKDQWFSPKDFFKNGIYA